MTCAHCRAATTTFGTAVADADRKRYRRKGPDRTTAGILEALAGLELPHATLLDVGGGIGVLHHELLEGAVTSAVHVEAAPAYLDAARAETAARGHADRVRFVAGDFVEVAGAVAPADVVTLDRVVCCYPDYARLLALAAEKCRRVCAVSFPRNRWYVRAVIGLQNLVRRLRGDAFRTYVHPEDAMRRVLAEIGLTRRSRRERLVWCVEVYERTGRAPPS